MPNRWYVETPYTQGNEPMKIYGDTIEEVRKHFPEAISITPCGDKSHLPYIKKMIDRSEFLDSRTNKLNQVTELYRYKGDGFDLYIKFYKDGKDNEYFDYSEIQLKSDGLISNHIGWTLYYPQDIYNRYFYSVPKKEVGYVVTPKEVKKNKYKKWYNKDGEYGWIDSDGYFYFADKLDMPNKKKKIVYDEFKDNDNAVLIKYKCATPTDYCPTELTRWFNSQEEFNIWWKQMVYKCPPFCESPYYSVVKKGFHKKHPDDRLVVLRMPYLNIEIELSDRHYEQVGRMWDRMCSKYYWYQRCVGTSWAEQIVKAYQEYLNKQREKEEFKNE